MIDYREADANVQRVIDIQFDLAQIRQRITSESIRRSAGQRHRHLVAACRRITDQERNQAALEWAISTGASK